MRLLETYQRTRDSVSGKFRAWRRRLAGLKMACPSARRRRPSNSDDMTEHGADGFAGVCVVKGFPNGLCLPGAPVQQDERHERKCQQQHDEQQHQRGFQPVKPRRIGNLFLGAGNQAVIPLRDCAAFAGGQAQVIFAAGLRSLRRRVNPDIGGLNRAVSVSRTRSEALSVAAFTPGKKRQTARTTASVETLKNSRFCRERAGMSFSPGSAKSRTLTGAGSLIRSTPELPRE